MNSRDRKVLVDVFFFLIRYIWIINDLAQSNPRYLRPTWEDSKKDLSKLLWTEEELSAD